MDDFLSPSGQPTIEILGLPIMEPMVTFTDFWITAVCLYAFFRLRAKGLSGRIHRYMRYYFLILAIATFLGGILGHAFQYAVGIEWKLPGWLISMIAVMAIERASIFQAQPYFSNRFGRLLEWFNVIELITFAVITFITLNFFLYKSAFCLWFKSCGAATAFNNVPKNCSSHAFGFLSEPYYLLVYQPFFIPLK